MASKQEALQEKYGAISELLRLDIDETRQNYQAVLNVVTTDRRQTWQGDIPFPDGLEARKKLVALLYAHKHNDGVDKDSVAGHIYALLEDQASDLPPFVIEAVKGEIEDPKVRPRFDMLPASATSGIRAIQSDSRGL